MATQAEIDAESGALLSQAELAKVKDIVEDQDFDQITALCAALQLNQSGVPLPDDQQGLLKITRNDLSQWFDRSEEGTTAVKGGKDGDDYNVLRDREEIRERLRLRLGLPIISQQRLDLMRLQATGFLPQSSTVYSKPIMLRNTLTLNTVSMPERRR